jgi:hypothetical protein
MDQRILEVWTCGVYIRRRSGGVCGTALVMGVSLNWERGVLWLRRCAAAALLCAALAGAAGCGAKAGMACQQQGDCRAGLICSKPPGAAPNAYGSCEPARRGLGESCVRSSECQTGLACSSARGSVGGDGWYGVCEPAPPDMVPPPDMATPDLVAVDL